MSRYVLQTYVPFILGIFVNTYIIIRLYSLSRTSYLVVTYKHSIVQIRCLYHVRLQDVRFVHEALFVAELRDLQLRKLGNFHNFKCVLCVAKGLCKSNGYYSGLYYGQVQDII